MGRPALDMTGERHGRLTVISRAGSAKYGGTTWNCVCDCGAERLVVGRFMRDGTTSSCGCLRRELCISQKSPLGAGAKTTHGMSGTKTYHAWQSMKARCFNPNNGAWRHYGGRGITVCDRWADSFENFLADLGEAPPERTLDRINVNGNYEPTNCRWATQDQQLENRRKHCPTCACSASRLALVY